MITIDHIQYTILFETGIKTSLKKGTGSMKAYTILSPMFQEGKYPEFPFDWRQAFAKTYPVTDPVSVMVSGTQIHIHNSLVTGEALVFKTERKPKAIEDRSVKSWGSKNSQLRLDKATARNAKRLRAGTTARYY